MRTLRFDAIIVGAGAAGMAAAIPLAARGYSCALVDRESAMGGILLQCIHNGFGLHHFGEELTGPEFAARLENDVRLAGVPFFSSTTVLSIERVSDDGANFRLLLSSAADGVTLAYSRAVILAMGSRERNRGNIRIAGDRPAGVFTAGLAQRLINVDGYLPGKNAVIIGSGDIGLIMARRLTLSGAKVAAVVEIQPFPSGLSRNVAQCLDDFGIPLYLSHATLRIVGKERVTAVEIAPLVNGAPNPERAFAIPCDTVLLSVGLVPENELSARAGVALDPVTNGAVVDSRLMTSVPGVFSAGNVLHIHDLVDRVAAEAGRAGSFCADWLAAETQGDSACRADFSSRGEIALVAGKNVRYTVPSFASAEARQTILLRGMIVMDKAALRISLGDAVLFEKKLSWIKPGEMIAAELPEGVLRSGLASESPLDVSLVAEENQP